MTATVSLDSTVESFEHWRATKKHSGASQIPEALWDMVFALEEKGFSASIIKRALSISSSQYQNQRNQRFSAKPAPAVLDKAKFVEAKCKAEPKAPKNESNKTVKAVKSNHKNDDWISTDTIIVECLRPDGVQLKIHTTNKRIHDILDAFFKAEYPAVQAC